MVLSEQVCRPDIDHGHSFRRFLLPVHALARAGRLQPLAAKGYGHSFEHFCRKD